MSEFPPHLRRFLPEAPEPSPAEQLDAWLAEKDASEPLPRTIAWRERWSADWPALLAVLGLIAATVGVMWLAGTFGP